MKQSEEHSSAGFWQVECVWREKQGGERWSERHPVTASLTEDLVSGYVLKYVHHYWQYQDMEWACVHWQMNG